MLLKLSTFNCRGLQDYVKRRKIFHYLRNTESDIIFLQETHSDKEDECFGSPSGVNHLGLQVTLLIAGGSPYLSGSQSQSK